jgi:hypothetical protein
MWTRSKAAAGFGKVFSSFTQFTSSDESSSKNHQVRIIK